ncbi:diadenosine tetraphosphate hydrolase [Candidatus Campbellbacteria bacterium CG22_combo_CG10-13_8_21_14_all_36_13]|uniref:Diadenosine tetraphosphate hydrolase n=1 Tax=Candidatus Campbellbacteria bacterium CG22_combo_CG10-13_8_21_14_all_36_13 TaxID=1974529 RepID=A0A2H0DYN3_9BACT|nr:MAG: diadenosine tetraphosphate hydrolase [Candidatus Campbellbacteria bacterium CG22_combo_CG10-13_8_21_14_all_36_13]
MDDCLFCKIVAGEVPSHKVWEDDKHLAFLTIFPNTEGATVVIPKEHYSSYVFELPNDVLAELMFATKKVAKLLDEKLEDVGRTGLIVEGFGVDHVHTKLFPMHRTADMSTWKKIESSLDVYFDKYPGYLSSHDARREDDEKLARLAKKIRN